LKRPTAASTNWSILVTALTLLLAAGPGSGRADEPEADPPGATDAPSPPAPSDPAPRPHLTINLKTQAWVTGGLLLFTGATQYYADKLIPSACRWCSPGQFDIWVRNELVWGDTKTASTASDALMVALPVGTALAMIFSARASGAGGREVVEDLLVVTESVATATALMQVAKFTAARLRPNAWAAGAATSGATSAASKMSFWAGHSSSGFAIAAGATQVARMRGRPSWKWIAVATFAGAAAISWTRIAADRHWGTDVLVGAAVGTTTGLVVPLLVFHPADGRAPAVTLVPAAGGLALLF
jgi:membrane-associated phospholipid phosphatase